jgi:peptidoglycan-associated lipoprotein
MNRNLLYSTTLAVVTVLAATGCRHNPVAVTPIPHGPGQVGDNGNPSTLQSTPPYNPNQNMGQSTAIAVGPYNPDNFTQDHDKLAADTIHFAFDSAVVRDSEQASIQAVAQELQNNPNEQLLVEGNCDERGTEEYNRSLGERRALAAREALAKLGISPDRVHEISYGKDKPADPGHDDAAWSKNRRDDFVVLIPKAGV